MNFTPEVEKVKDTYSRHGVYAECDFLDKIQESQYRKRKYFGKMFENGDTIELEMSARAKLHYLYEENYLGYKAKNQLKEAGYDIEDLSIVDNKIKRKSDKQYTKVTKVLKRLDNEFWTDFRLGDLYQKLSASKYILSIDPYEFQTASENCGWSSCFRIDGEYHCSVWAYYNTVPTLIIKALNNDGTATGRIFVSIDEDQLGIVAGRIYGALIDSEVRRLLEIICTKLELPYTEWEDLDVYDIKYSYNSSNTYIDNPHYVFGTGRLHINMETGIDYEGEDSTRGYFCGTCCDCCDEISNDTTNVDGRDLCQDCLDAYYVYSDILYDYIAADDAIFIEDLGDYDDVYNNEKYYFIDMLGEYYKELPEDFCVCEYTDEVQYTADCVYIDHMDIWVHKDYADEEMFRDNTKEVA